MNDTIVNTTDIWNNVTTPLQSSNLPSWFLRLNVGVRLIEGFLAVMTNGLTILAVAKYESLRTNANLLICSLAGADLLGGLTPIFLLAHFNLESDLHRWLIFCTLEISFNLFSSGLNLMTITWMAADRFMYINFPLRYYTLMKTWHVWASLGISTILSTALIAAFSSAGVQASEDDLLCRANSLYVNRTLSGQIVNTTFVVLTAIILLLYGRIAFIAHRQARSIGSQMSGAGDPVSTLSRAEAKITKMMAVILGIYACCYIPQVLTLMVVRALDDPPRWLAMVERGSSWIWWANSWMNPFIYAWKSRQFNRAFRHILGLKTIHEAP